MSDQALAEKLAEQNAAMEHMPLRFPVGNDLLDRWSDATHREDASQCGVCGNDCATVALTDLCYSFEECDCNAWPYAHLVENLWHRECFAAEFVRENA